MSLYYSYLAQCNFHKDEISPADFKFIYRISLFYFNHYYVTCPRTINNSPSQYTPYEANYFCKFISFKFSPNKSLLPINVDPLTRRGRVFKHGKRNIFVCSSDYFRPNVQRANYYGSASPSVTIKISLILSNLEANLLT